MIYFNPEVGFFKTLIILMYERGIKEIQMSLSFIKHDR